MTKHTSLLKGVRLKQHIRFPLFECLFRRISVLRVTSRRGGWVRQGGCYNTLAERYRERICCFTLTLLKVWNELFYNTGHWKEFHEEILITFTHSFHASFQSSGKSVLQ